MLDVLIKTANFTDISRAEQKNLHSLRILSTGMYDELDDAIQAVLRRLDGCLVI
jgi:hypothetical protein